MMMPGRTISKAMILLASAMAAAGALPFIPAAWLPAASPFVAICSAVALRNLAFIALLALPLLLLGVFKGAWFCFNLCPMGFLLVLAGKLNPRRKSVKAGIPCLARWLAVAGLGGSIFGAPLFLWLDPLVIFTGFFGAVGKVPAGWAEMMPALVLIVVVFLSILAPGLWCQRLCPLGATMAQLGRPRDALLAWARKRRAGSDDIGKEARLPGPALGRRSFLFLLGGVGAGAAIRLTGTPDSRGALRPPGAANEDIFGSLCARCGNCFRICPQKIIVPDMGETGLTGFFSPVLDFDSHYCSEWCNECGKVCPTRAIESLSLDEKRRSRIGVAHVNRTECLAWEHGNYCMICQEYCPYQAIDSVEHQGMNCPVVKEDACRGCGACQSQCPARPDRAIVVKPHLQGAFAQGKYLKAKMHQQICLTPKP